MNEVDITLAKAKYRPKNCRRLKRQFDPEGGTLVFMAGGFGAKSSNQGTANRGQTIRPRRRSYGPW
jgi:hypothetical protein